MIIKLLSRRSNPAQLVSYVSRYLVRDKKHTSYKEQMKVLLEHNLRNAHTVEEYIAAFKQNESYRMHTRKDNTVLFHSILSLSPDDKERITQPMLTDLARQFVELRGTNCLHLAVAHFEKSHVHVHIVTSGVTVGGKSSRMSRDHFTHLLTSLEEYQHRTYPELTNSHNTHEKIQVSDVKQLSDHFRERRKTTKLLLHEQLQSIIQNAASYSLFCQELATYNYALYHRNGIPQGIIANGMKYRFTSIGLESKSISDLQVSEQALADITAVREKHLQKDSFLTKAEQLQPSNDIEEELLVLRQIQTRDIQGTERDFGSISDYRGMGPPH